MADTIDKIALINGYDSPLEMVVKFVIPYSLGSFIVGSFIIALIPALPLWFGFGLIFFGGAYGFLAPAMKFYQQKADIERRLFFFITYAGTVSTMKISISQLFTRLSDKKYFGSIGMLFEKILYLAKAWNLGYASACRHIGNSCPSRIMADFLDRMAVAVEMGQELGPYMIEEQAAVMSDFGSEYKKQIETLKTLQEVFISLSISAALVLGVILLGPLLADMDMNASMINALIGFVVMDLMLIMMFKANTVYDPIYAEISYENTTQKKLRIIMFVCVFISLGIFVTLGNTTAMPFLFNLAFSSLPLIIPSFLYRQYEEQMIKSDYAFPVYIRAIGSSIDVRRGAVARALQATQVHDFGILNKPSLDLYKRLKLGNDKFKCWHIFGSDIGTYLIYNFARIFSQSVYLGGNAKKIGQIISTNLTKVLELRKMKYHIKDGIKHSFYGILIGLSATLFVSVKISELLVAAFSSSNTGSSEMQEFISSILPNAIIDFQMVFFLLSLLLVVHVIMMCYGISIIHGTRFSNYFLDIVIMIWLVAIISWAGPMMVKNLIPDVNVVLSGGGEI
ncbi:hypothetical protein H6503_02825 [Candidatus Woesearchaeota archaeon]|nr:hypothetical protein [Candidatus Woesearchaeota archaeon]